MDWNRALTILLIGLTVINLSWTGAIYTDVSSLDQQVNEIDQTQQRIEKQILGSVEPTGNGSDGGFASRQVTVGVLGYDTSSNAGQIVPFHILTVAGEGLYVDTGEVTYDVSTQQSFRNAYQVVYNSSYAPEQKSVVITLDPPSYWDNVGGESAGLATAIGIAATNPDVRLNESVAMTGGISKEGDITRVSHIREKAKAAESAGYDIFLVPYGQKVNVEGINVVAVQTFSDAAEYALEPATNASPS